MDFVNRLRPEHLSSFWYFPSKVNFALIATFGSLLLATAPGQEEADFYRTRLVEYRWTLCVSSKSAEFLSFAVDSLDTSSLLLRSLPPKPSTSELLHTTTTRGARPGPGSGPGPGQITEPALTSVVATTSSSSSTSSSSISWQHQPINMILSKGTTPVPSSSSSSRGDGAAAQQLISSSGGGLINYMSKGDDDAPDHHHRRRASSPSSSISASSGSGSTTYEVYG